MGAALRTFLLLILCCSAAAQPRPLELTARFRAHHDLAAYPLGGAGPFLRPPAVERYRANAIAMGHDRALTVVHAVFRPGHELLTVDVDGQPAKIVSVGVGLVHLAVGGLDVAPAEITVPWDDASPQEGERLLHRYWDGGEQTRWVTWDGAGVQEGFVRGMSGSGIYDRAGRLCAVAETTSGGVWGPLDVAVETEQ